MTNDLDLEHGYSIGEAAFEVVCRLFREASATRIVEFGSGRSSVRLLLELHPTKFLTIEDQSKYVLATEKSLLKYGYPTDHLLQAPIRTIEFRSRWLYRTYLLPDDWWKGRIDAVLVDGPSGSVDATARGGALFWVWDKLHAQSIVILDDANRDGEKQILKDWLQAFPITVELINVGHGLAVIRKKD